jgi:tRNA threonylcarbamoyl adenosine modification protein YeaZ
VLAIESAISGGSVSLLRNGGEIANWIGNASSISKAEELLVNIDHLLVSSGVDKNELDLIAVSAGPGSFTGTRIGIATALGLKTGLGIKMASESALKAVAFTCDSPSKEFTVALPVGRNSVCVQRFEQIVPIDEPRTVTEDAFLALVADRGKTAFVLHRDLYDRAPLDSGIISAGANIARSIGLICSGRGRSIVVEPLFIAKSF